MDINYYKQFEPIDGKWYINKELGSGAFGQVFEIERRDFSNIKAALKVVSIPNSQSEFKSFRDDNFDMDDKSVTSYFYGFVEEFVKEFQVMSRLKGHTNIVSYEDHDVKEKKDGFGWDIFIRMELLTPMNEYFRMNTPRQSDVIKIGIDICKALEVCQKYNIIHRDIKPSNIFVSENGDFKLGDFGVARTLEKTSSGLSKKGTYTYMAPEVYKGEKYNSNVDMYSLGILMYKLLNNNMEPFRTDKTYSDGEKALSMRMSGEEIPVPSNAEGRLAEIVLKACRYNPKERYESPVQMRTELEKILYNKEESKLVYPNGDQLDYEASIGTSEKEITMSMYSDDVAENDMRGILTEKNKTDKTVSMFSDETKDSKEGSKGNVLIKNYCPNCGSLNDKRQNFCVHCGTALSLSKKSDGNVKSKERVSTNIKKRRFNMRYCSKCGNQINDEVQKFCSKCGAELQNDFVIRENTYNEFNTIKKEFSMKWYKFLIYFALFLGAFLNICTAILYFNGDIYFSQTNGQVTAKMVYGMYGDSLKVWDVLYGVLLLSVAVFSIVVRNRLAKHKSNAPKCVYALYIAGGAVSLIYNIGVLFITNVAGVLNAAFWFGEVVTAIFVFANYKYFSKRAELFMN